MISAHNSRNLSSFNISILIFLVYLHGTTGSSKDFSLDFSTPEMDCVTMVLVEGREPLDLVILINSFLYETHR
jgi:hypothetical protein